MVRIYLMKSYQLVPGKCLLDKNAFVLQDTPFVKNDEILKYSVSTHEYTITRGCQEKFRSLPPRTPLAITVNNQVIFTAFNVPGYISSTCDNSIVLTPSDSTPTIRVNLGYPGINNEPGIDDQRNNVKLVAALAEQGKLH